MQNKYLSDIINVDPENDIEHHGVLGMKWGIRRYQPYSLIPRKSGKAGKETGTAKKKSKSSAKPVISKKASSRKVSDVKKTRKQKSAEAKAAIEKQAKTARQRQQELEKIVNSGDAKQVYEHRSELTNKQLNAAIERINTEARVASLVRQQNPTKMDKLKTFAGQVKDVNSVIGTGIDTYKNIKTIKDLYSDAKNAKTAAEKADASAKVLKTIIDSGNTAQDIKTLQSKLSKEDLETATKRLTNLATIDKNETEMRKRARQELKDSEKYRKDRASYLDRTLKDIESGKERSEKWTSKFNPTVEETKRDYRSTRDLIDEDAKRFNVSNTRESDDYFESRVGNHSRSPKTQSASEPKPSGNGNKSLDNSSRSVKTPTKTSDFYDNVASGKRASKEEIDRLLREIDDAERPVKRLRKKR